MEPTDIMMMVTDALLPVVTGVAGFLGGRRKRRNDFLADLQRSIDALSAKNTEQMGTIISLNDTVVKLRRENAEMRGEVAALRRENSDLKTEVEAMRLENAKLSGEIAQLREQLDGVKTITRVRRGDA